MGLPVGTRLFVMCIRDEHGLQIWTNTERVGHTYLLGTIEVDEMDDKNIRLWHFLTATNLDCAQLITLYMQLDIIDMKNAVFTERFLDSMTRVCNRIANHTHNQDRLIKPRTINMIRGSEDKTMKTVQENVDDLFANRKSFTKVQSVRYKHVVVNAFGTPIRVSKDRPAAEAYCTQHNLGFERILLIPCDEQDGTMVQYIDWFVSDGHIEYAHIWSDPGPNGVRRFHVW